MINHAKNPNYFRKTQLSQTTSTVPALAEAQCTPSIGKLPTIRHARETLRWIALVLVLLSCSYHAIAQMPKMIMPKVYWDYSTNSYLNLPTSTISSNYANQQANISFNAMYAPDGSILFFIVDGYIYDGYGAPITFQTPTPPNGNGVGLPPDQPILNAAGEIVIIPKPGDCSKYYIVAAHASNYVFGIYSNLRPVYYTIDMSIHNPYSPYNSNSSSCTSRGNGVILGSSSQINYIEAMNQGNELFAIDVHNNSMHFALTPLHSVTIGTITTDYRFLFIKNSHSIYRMKVDENGIVWDTSNPDYEINLNQVSPINSLRFCQSEMEVIKTTTGFRLAAPAISAAFGFIYVADMNYIGTIVAGSEKRIYFPTNSLGNSQPYTAKGIEFSPNGQYLYFTHVETTPAPAINPNNYVQYANLAGSNPTPSIQTLSTANSNTYQFSFIERGFDNNLYLCKADGIHKLTNPDNPSLATLAASPITPLPAGVSMPIANGIASNIPNAASYDLGLLNSYLLPDQIDGENYLNAFNITASPERTASCCVRWTNFFTQNGNCDIEINPTNITDFTTPNTMYFNGTVTINLPSNTSTIFAGKTWYFGPKGKLVIPQGKRLALSGTKLTNSCNLMWIGVEVWGNTLASQTAVNQGVLIMNTASTIENAYVGVVTAKRTLGIPVTADLIAPFASNYYELNSYGGMVICNGTYNTSTFVTNYGKFNNNGRDAIILRYRNMNNGVESDNRSYFQLTEFVVDNNYIGKSLSYDGTGNPLDINGNLCTASGLQQAFVNYSLLEDIQFRFAYGVKLKGCWLHDTRLFTSQNPIYTHGRIGINANNAGFRVQSYYATTPPTTVNTVGNVVSKFEKLRYGIYAQGLVNTAKSITVYNAFFESWYGAYINGVKNTDWRFNKFHVGYAGSVNPSGTPFNNTSITPYGLYIDQLSQNFKCEGNLFDGRSASGGIQWSSFHRIGCVVRNNQDAQDEIEKNYFRGLSVGFESIDNNRDMPNNLNTTNYTGLKLRCNQHNNSRYDNYIKIASPTSAGFGISNQIGMTNSNVQNTTLAGNTFSNQTNYLTNPEGNFKNEGGQIQYTTHDATLNARLVPVGFLQQNNAYYSSSNINIITLNSNTYGNLVVYDSTASCPFQSVTANLRIASTNVQNMNANLQSLKATYDNLADGGNTHAVILELIEVEHTTAYATYDELMRLSPNLTEAVLIDVAANEILSAAMIRNILVSNPIAARSAEVQAKLDARINLLSAYMREQIDAEAATMSSFDNLITSLKGQAEEMYSITQNEIHNHLSTDSVFEDSIYTVLGMMPDMASKSQKAMLKFSNGFAEEAFQLLGDLKANLRGKDADDMQETIDYLQWYREKTYTDEDLTALASADIDMLQTIKTHDNWASAQANALLALNGIASDEAMTYFPDESNTRKAKHKTRPVGADEKLGLEISPNPAKDYLLVKYHLQEMALPIGTTLKIIALDGKLLQQISLSNVQDQIIIDTKQLLSGTYILQIADAKVIYNNAKFEVIK